jgi:hypothetical protein
VSKLLSVLVFAFGLVTSNLAYAAIALDHTTAGGLDIFIIRGTFEATDDVSSLLAEIGRSKGTFIGFDSSGGDPEAAMKLGRAVRKIGLPTLDVAGSQCHGACLLAFIGGKTRFAEEGAIAIDDSLRDAIRPDTEEGRQIRAYLVEMGIPTEFFERVASSPSGTPSPLSLVDLAGFQIVTGQPTVYEAPTPEELQVSTEQSDPALDAAAVSFFEEFQRAWSSPTDEALSFLTSAYPPQLDYYGKTRRLDEVLAEKQQFTERWPSRVYSPRTGSVYASCFSTCAIFGIVDWFTFSPTRKKATSGAFNFVLNWDPASHKILSENGHITTTDKSLVGPDRIIRRWVLDSTSCALKSASDPDRACRTQDVLKTEIERTGWCRQDDATWKTCRY